MRYRAEIDGLRALAVIPVILFHAGFQMFSGGFVGVDVFFVISGYLITSIILRELQDGKFSIFRFYERRTRRILPALFLVVFASMPFAGMWFIPSDLHDYSDSLIAVATFTSNFLFWKESGYFATTTELKPLLHTWSLAVEEQYYIFFPLFMLAAWRLGKQWVLGMLIAAFVFSFAFAQWAAHHNSAAAFYLWPSRSWELSVGVFAAFFLNRYGDVEIPYVLRQVGSLTGIGLILISVFFFDQKTPFPGVYALVPTVGAVLVILFARQQTIAQKLLSNRLFVGIGLVSFSAYLWHQPMFAYAKYLSSSHPPTALMLVLCLFSFVFAYFSWRFVETPFRDKSLVGRRPLIISAIVSSALIILIGYVGHKTDGFEKIIVDYRLSDDQATRYSLITRDTQYSFRGSMVDNGDCQFWASRLSPIVENRFKKCAEKYGKSVVVVGDSHSMNIYNAFAKANILPFLVNIADGGCRPYDDKPNCPYEAFLQFVQKYDDVIRVILYHQSGSYFVRDSRGKIDSQFTFTDGQYSFVNENIDNATNYLEKLDAVSNSEIIWIGPFVEYRYDPKDAIHRSEYLKVNPVSEQIFSDLDAYLSKTRTGKNGVPIIPFGQIYSMPKSAIVDECFIFYDKDHISRCGEDLVAKSETVRTFLKQFN